MRVIFRRDENSLASALSPENTILFVLLRKKEKKEVTQCIRKIDSRRRYKVASIPLEVEAT